MPNQGVLYANNMIVQKMKRNGERKVYLVKEGKMRRKGRRRGRKEGNTGAAVARRRGERVEKKKIEEWQK